MRSIWIVLMVVSCMFRAGAVCGEPQGGSSEHQAAVAVVLKGASTMADLDRMAGIPFIRCIVNSETTRLCEWQMGNRESGWKALADAIRTSDRITLVCELPIDDGPRVDDSCTAYPQRSNRAQFTQRPPGPGGRRKGASSSRSALSGKENQQIARSWLADASNLLEMSRLMGAIPNQCQAQGNREQVCTWRATSRMVGHGTVAASIGADSSKKVRLRCRFRLDGRPRALDACEASIGD